MQSTLIRNHDWRNGGSKLFALHTSGRIALWSIILIIFTSCGGVTPSQAQEKVKADSAAYALLESAHKARQVLPNDFSGFDAQIVFQYGAMDGKGTLQYRRGQKTVLQLNGADGDAKAWLEDQILSIIGHRRGGDFAQGDGRFPITFGKAPDNHFGKLIELNDGMESSYRVRDSKVLEVTRSAGDTRFTISVIETIEADPGKYLANHFMVSYRDKKSGALHQVQGFRDTYKKIGSVWLPASRSVITFATEVSPQMRRIQFQDIKLLQAANAAPAKAQ